MKKKVLSLLLAGSLLLGALAVPASAAELPFGDVPEKAWYREAVTYVYENGLFQGNSATQFAPDASMTRAMFVQVLANKTGNYDKADWAGKSSFFDVRASAWYAAPIQWASKAGLVSGVGNGRFEPETNVSREEMAVILYNYAKKTGNDASLKTDALAGFSDASRVASWAKEPMQWAVTHGVVKGSGGRIDPKSNAKRCEVAQVFANAAPLLVKNEVDVSGEDPEPSPEPSPEPDPGPSGGGGGGPKPTPAPTPVPTPDPAPPADSPLLKYSTVADWNSNLTRRQCAELLLAFYEALGGKEIEISPDVSFTDIDAEDSKNQIILKVVSAGFMSGDFSDKFHPELAHVLRSEAAGGCVRAVDRLMYSIIPPNNIVPPSDVKEFSWYYDIVNFLCWAVDYREDSFRPQDNVKAREMFDWLDTLFRRYQEDTPTGVRAESVVGKLYQKDGKLYSLPDAPSFSVVTASDRTDYCIPREDLYDLFVLVGGLYEIKSGDNAYLAGYIDPYSKITKRETVDGWQSWKIGPQDEMIYEYQDINTGPATQITVFRYTYHGKTLVCDPRELPNLKHGEYVTDKNGIRWTMVSGRQVCSLRDIYGYFGINEGFSLGIADEQTEPVTYYFSFTGPVDSPSIPEAPEDPVPGPVPEEESISLVSSQYASFFGQGEKLYQHDSSLQASVFQTKQGPEQYISASSLYVFLIVRNSLYDIKPVSNQYLDGWLDIYSRIKDKDSTEEDGTIWNIGENSEVVYAYKTVYTGPSSQFSQLSYTCHGKKLVLDGRFDRDLAGRYGRVDGVRYTNSSHTLYLNFSDVCAFFDLPTTLSFEPVDPSGEERQSLFRLT